MRKTMIQQVMTSPGIIEFRDIPVPEPKENEVLVQIQRIGVCGSDIHVNHGKHPYTSYPVTQGHEVSALIEKCGSQVQTFKVGDHVTIQPQVVCGRCYSCTHGKYHICDSLKVMGFQTTGMASEYFCCDADRVLKLPEGMTPDEGAMIEPAAVACHALSRIPDLKGKKILVIGAGPIGNLVAQTAKGKGAESVMITDLSDFRLNIASRVGIDHAVNAGRGNLNDAVIKAFGRDKADAIFECVGAQGTIDNAIGCARKGTDIVIVGVFGDKPMVDLGLLQDRELRIIGTAMYQTGDYRDAIRLVQEKKVLLDPLMTDHFAFEEYEKAYSYIDERKDRAMKVFIDIN